MLNKGLDHARSRGGGKLSYCKLKKADVLYSVYTVMRSAARLGLLTLVCFTIFSLPSV